MTFSPEVLAAELARLEANAGSPSRFVVAFSGGMDSSALLYALADLESGVEIIAVHVNHGLQAASDDWERHCRDTAKTLGVDFRCVRANVDLDAGKGPEAAARDARYAALTGEIEPGDWLLTAHHGEDQAETLLLNLVRGGGPIGLAGVADIRPFATGWLVRPLLGVRREALHDYSTRSKLEWIEDPTNSELHFDRNYLRHEVVPALDARWPDATSRLNRSASHARDAAGLLDDLARIDLDAVGGEPARLNIDGLSSLSLQRQGNVIRYALRIQGLPVPTTRQLEQVLKELVTAREDAQPLVSWSGVCVRRYRNGLYLMGPDSNDELQDTAVTDDFALLGGSLGTLRFESGAESGLDPKLLAAGLQVRSRVGGEEIQLFGQQHTRTLKKLLQEEGVVPWMRKRIPLIYCGERLVAVGDLWLAADAVSRPGVRLRWRGRPALH